MTKKEQDTTTSWTYFYHVVGCLHGEAISRGLSFSCRLPELTYSSFSEIDTEQTIQLLNQIGLLIDQINTGTELLSQGISLVLME